MTPVTIHIPLTPLDHAPPKNYSCSLNYLRLKPGVQPEKVFDILQEGLHRTFVQIPWLSGRVWPQSRDTLGHRPGQLEIRHEPVTLETSRPYQIKFNVINSARTYEDIEELAFPTDSFPDESLIWAPFMPDLNDGPEVLVAQANFIPGACILTAGTFHSAADGVGGVSIFKLWADHCRAIQRNEGLWAVMPPTEESSNRGLLDKAWAEEGTGTPVDHINPLTWTLLGLAPPSPASPPKNRSNGVESDENQEPPNDNVIPSMMKSAIFYVPAAKFNNLQKECRQEGANISGTDSIVALIWRCALRARRAAALRADKATGEISKPDAVAYLALTVDGRPYFSQSVPSTYLGNLTCINLAAMSLAHLTSADTSLSAVARTIRDTANGITTSNLLDAYTFARSVPDFADLSLQNAPLDGTAMVVSPLLTYPTASVSFGDTVFENGGMLEALRMPMYSFNRMTRLCLVLPRLASGGAEFLLNLFDEEMELLLQDKEFSRYAMFLTQ